MLRLRLHKGRYFIAGVAAVATALFGLVPLTAASAATPSAVPYFTHWKVGAPLPAVRAGYRWEALQSSNAAMKALRPGSKVAMTAISVATARARSSQASWASLANTAGYVNLEAVPAIGCTPLELQENLKNEATDVAQSYATNAHTTQAFKYGAGQSSSLEVGLSDGGGGDGTYSADGTISTSTSGSQDFPTQSGVSYNTWRGYFESGKFLQECGPTSKYYYVELYEWNAGDDILHPGGPPATPHCSPELAGSTFHQSTTTASTFDVGFETPVGFSGSSRTGYSTSAELSFHFTRAGQICGRNAIPPNSSGVDLAANPAS
jgi:hypothetical protein